MRANKLFGILLTTIDNNDEIIILSDQNDITEELKFLISLSYYQKEYPIKHISYPLDGDFATFKNNLINVSTKNIYFK